MSGHMGGKRRYFDCLLLSMSKIKLTSGSQWVRKRNAMKAPTLLHVLQEMLMEKNVKKGGALTYCCKKY